MLSSAYWLTFSPELRKKLVRLFNISRSSGSVVETSGGRGRLVSDGHTPEDLTAINIDILQKMLATKSTDYYVMLNQVVEGVDKFLEIKESGAVDGDWNYTEVAKKFDEADRYKVIEDLVPGDLVRIKNGEVYKVSHVAGRPKKHV